MSASPSSVPSSAPPLSPGSQNHSYMSNGYASEGSYDAYSPNGKAGEYFRPFYFRVKVVPRGMFDHSIIGTQVVNKIEFRLKIQDTQIVVCDFKNKLA